jgi:hypothetical protein
MIHIETAIKKRHLVIPTQQIGVEALAPVFSRTKDIRRILRVLFQDAVRVQKNAAELDKVVGLTMGDVQLSALQRPDQGGYYVMLDRVQDTGDNLIILPYDDLARQVAEKNPVLEQAVVIGSATIIVCDVGDATHIAEAALMAIPFVQEIPLIEGHIHPPVSSMRPMNYSLRYFAMRQGRSAEAYAQALFRARTFSFPPDQNHPQGQQFDEIVRGVYQTEQGLTVFFSARPPTEAGVAIQLTLSKVHNPFLGRLHPMISQEAAFVEKSLRRLKQGIEEEKYSWE